MNGEENERSNQDFNINNNNNKLAAEISSIFLLFFLHKFTEVSALGKQPCTTPSFAFIEFTTTQIQCGLFIAAFCLCVIIFRIIENESKHFFFDPL